MRPETCSDAAGCIVVNLIGIPAANRNNQHYGFPLMDLVHQPVSGSPTFDFSSSSQIVQ